MPSQTSIHTEFRLFVHYVCVRHPPCVGRPRNEHTLQSCKYAIAQVASGSGDAKFLRQNQEWPKKVVFSRACRTHTLALSMIRTHMAERSLRAWTVCRRHMPPPPSLLPSSLLPSLLPSLTFCFRCHLSALTPPPPSPASAYLQGRPSSLWLASGYHQGAGLRMREHCARAARQRTEQSAAASSNTEKAKWPLDAFVVCVHEVCCRMIKICMSVMPINCYIHGYHSLEI